jgi:hypothetical protein
MMVHITPNLNHELDPMILAKQHYPLTLVLSKISSWGSFHNWVEDLSHTSISIHLARYFRGLPSEAQRALAYISVSRTTPSTSNLKV